MYYYLQGKIAHCDRDLIVIDVGGVGYACHASLSTISRIKPGETMKLFTHFNVKEDAHDLFGFYSLEEKSLFLQLLSVTGVGPKAALSILSVAAPEQLALAVATEDEKMFTQASGVGKKLAQRIILELKDKFAKQLPDTGGVMVSTPISGNMSALRQAQAALAALGYSASESAHALKELDAEMSVEEMISAALTRLV